MTAPATKRKPATSPAAGAEQAQALAHQRHKARPGVESGALRQSEAAWVEVLPVQHPHVASIDIGSRSHWVCVGFASLSRRIHPV